MHSIPDTTKNRHPRDAYDRFEIIEKESRNAAHTALDEYTGEPARFTFRLGRVPSRQQIVVWHLAGSDPLERLEAVVAAETYRRRGRSAHVAAESWTRHKLSKSGGWWFCSPCLGLVIDADARFEALMRAEFTEPLNIETRIAA